MPSTSRPYILALAIGGLAFAIATTGTAVATSGQLVHLTDPFNGTNKARVDSAGRLHVGDGAGPLDVTGSVTARPAPPSAAWTRSADLYVHSTCYTLYAPPTGKAAVLSGLEATKYGTNTSRHTSILFTVGAQPCQGTIVAMPTLGAPGSVTKTFPTGVNIPAGQQLSYHLFAGTDPQDYWVVGAEGYTVPATAVPAGAGASTTSPPLRAPR